MLILNYKLPFKYVLFVYLFVCLFVWIFIAMIDLIMIITMIIQHENASNNKVSLTLVHVQNTIKLKCNQFENQILIVNDTLKKWNINLVIITNNREKLSELDAGIFAINKRCHIIQAPRTSYHKLNEILPLHVIIYTSNTWPAVSMPYHFSRVEVLWKNKLEENNRHSYFSLIFLPEWNDTLLILEIDVCWVCNKMVSTHLRVFFVFVCLFVFYRIEIEKSRHVVISSRHVFILVTCNVCATDQENLTYPNFCELWKSWGPEMSQSIKSINQSNFISISYHTKYKMNTIYSLQIWNI